MSKQLCMATGADSSGKRGRLRQIDLFGHFRDWDEELFEKEVSDT